MFDKKVSYPIPMLPMQTRNKALAWRPLAYIPDPDLHYSSVQKKKFAASVKQIRLFKLFSVAIQSFIDAQQEGSMDNVYLVLGGKAKYVILKIPLAYIIGDNQGGDTIAGRICFYGITAKRISRCCDATAENYDDMSPGSCAFLNMEDIMEMVDHQRWQDLEDLYQSQCWNPFFEVDYGANPAGIFLAACPPEGLHALEQGIFKHLLDEILGQLLKPEQIALLDREVQSWVVQPRQRLFRSSNFSESPRLMFKDGISSLKNTPGCDRAGMMFALSIATLTRDGHAAFGRLDEDVTLNISYTLEMLLCYWAWLKKTTYWNIDSPSQLENVKIAVSTLLDELVSCVPRLKGNGWNIPKVHEQLHVPAYIQMFGAHRNLHTGPTEHNHIELSKKTARRTQMRANDFDWQVSNRLVDKFVVDIADFTMSDDLEEPSSETQRPNGIPHNSAVFDILIWKDAVGGVHADMATPSTHGKFMPCQAVLHCLTKHCLGGAAVVLEEEAIRICCVTEFVTNHIHLRTNPVERDGAWFDNVVIKGQPDEHNIVSLTQGNLKFMFCFSERPLVYYGVLHPAYGYYPQYSVLTHMYRMQYVDDPDDILGSSDHFDQKGDCWILDDDDTLNGSSPYLLVVCLDAVESHLLMIPYHTHSKFKIGVISQTLWADKFVTY